MRAGPGASAGPGAGREAICADQYLTLGVVNRADGEGSAVLFGSKANRDSRARGYPGGWQGEGKRTEGPAIERQRTRKSMRYKR